MEEVMLQGDSIWVGQGTARCALPLSVSNRHGLIAGASGTGKTVTLKVLAQGFSQAGVPVFLADVKGDVSGMAEPGEKTDKIESRLQTLGIDDFPMEACPCRFWDMLSGNGAAIRITISDMGPIMLSRMLGLTDVQEGVLNLVFRIADDNGLLLIDLKDLRAVLNYVAEHSKEYETTYGKVSSQSVGAILRSLMAIEDQGATAFFGEPAIDLSDFMQCSSDGRGYVNILDATKLISSPQVYAMFLLWMINELFETLPEVGDPDKPKMVFFFDEAHLLFNGMPSVLTEKMLQVVKLIRSKGVGIYFITQSPSDIPDEVLSQLSNRIQHGLRAYTPAEQKKIKATAKAFRANPEFNTEDALQELATGEALISFLSPEGQPEIVERAIVLPPQCNMGAASPETIASVIKSESALMDKYGNAVDRESAFEMLEKQASEEQAQAQQEEAQKAESAEQAKALERAEKEAAAAAKAEERAAKKQQEQMSKTMSSIIGQIGREAGRQLVRGLFGGLRR